MESKIRKKEPVLLPLYFKKIGVSVMILAVISAVTVKLLNVQLGQTQKELFRLFLLNAIILGLVFLAWSRDKMEDEMTRSIRLISMSWTLLWAVLLVVIKPLIDLIFQDPVNQFTGQEFVIIMLIYYLCTTSKNVTVNEKFAESRKGKIGHNAAAAGGFSRCFSSNN